LPIPKAFSMKRIDTSLPGVLLLEPRVFGDNRGFFLESYNQRVFAELGIAEPFVQDNHSYSERNVIRGLHYQIHQPQGKLVRAITGEILDVALDLRRSSPTFGKSERRTDEVLGDGGGFCSNFAATLPRNSE
jgi:dTDP-4-dehydrorhamnose 3,5-epimerase